MIFAHTHKLATSGLKRQTIRLCYPGDFLGRTPLGETAVFEKPYLMAGQVRCRPRWIVGHEYAIQPERCHPEVGRFRCTYLKLVENPLNVDQEFARAEGFQSIEEYLEVWKKLHPKNLEHPCWAIGMELVEKGVNDALRQAGNA